MLAGWLPANRWKFCPLRVIFSFIYNGQISQLDLRILLYFTEYMWKRPSTKAKEIELIL